MNKFAALLAAGMLLSGCVYNSKVSTGAEQLQHHRFVLTSVNGQAVNASDRPLELSFGEKMAITGKMYVSGNMCNGFSGEGKVSDGELKVKSLAMTGCCATMPSSIPWMRRSTRCCARVRRSI